MLKNETSPLADGNALGGASSRMMSLRLRNWTSPKIVSAASKRFPEAGGGPRQRASEPPLKHSRCSPITEQIDRRLLLGSSSPSSDSKTGNKDARLVVNIFLLMRLYLCSFDTIRPKIIFMKTP